MSKGRGDDWGDLAPAGNYIHRALQNAKMWPDEWPVWPTPRADGQFMWTACNDDAVLASDLTFVCVGGPDFTCPIHHRPAIAL
jgi:hypothetical protein